MLRIFRFALIALIATLASAAPAFADQASSPTATPQQVVQGIADDLGRALDGHRDELRKDPNHLIKLIDGILLPHFDVDYASLLVLGTHARAATPDQRERFSHAFYNSITHRYAEGLLNYTKGRVKVLSADGEANTKRSIVRTQVMLSDGKSLSVDYAFRKTASGDWKAYDVIIEGISYITNYRNQVDAEIQKEGIEGLIKRLQSQGAAAIDQMQKEAQQPAGH